MKNFDLEEGSCLPNLLEEPQHLALDKNHSLPPLLEEPGLSGPAAPLPPPAGMFRHESPEQSPVFLSFFNF